MTDKPDNPLAFPFHNPYYDGNWNKDFGSGGMTLRDYFAAHCPMTLETYLMGVDKSKIQTWKTADALGSFANARYQYAQAMLKSPPINRLMKEYI